MKIIYSIARNEFRHLFYSPYRMVRTARVSGSMFYFYTGTMLSAAEYQDLMLQNSPSFKGFDESLTKNLFLDTEFFYRCLQEPLVIYSNSYHGTYEPGDYAEHECLAQFLASNYEKDCARKIPGDYDV